LLELPGVGKYIARSVCANAFGQPKAVLDTNVARILQRFFGIDQEFQRWYKPPHLSVESIQNRKAKILKPPHLSVGSI